MTDDSLMSEFFIDTQGHLENIEEDALRLEKSPSDADIIGDVFRRVHSIKGNAGIMGLAGVYEYGQEFESFLEGIRERKTATSGEIEKIFKYLDGLKANISALKGESSQGSDQEPGAEETEDLDLEDQPAEPLRAAPRETSIPQKPMGAPAPEKTGPAEAPHPAGAKAQARPEGNLTALTFKIGGESYGIDIMRVKEIITYEMVTRVPNTKWFVEGVMNLRDQVIPVLDLRKKLKIKTPQEAIQAARERSIVIVDVAKVATGLVVDDVTGIKTFDWADITQPHEFAGKISDEFLAGVGRVEDGAVILLNVQDVCDPVEMLY